MPAVVQMEWRQSPRFPAFEVSESGDVRRISTGTRMRGYINSDGYPCYNLRDIDGKPCHITAHRLVAELFVGPPPSDNAEVAHRDGSRLNAHHSNLRWATRKSNNDDRVVHGTSARGEGNPRAKITEADALAIRREYREIKRPGSGRQVSELEARYGLHRSTVTRIAKGQYWPHLNEVQP